MFSRPREGLPGQFEDGGAREEGEENSVRGTQNNFEKVAETCPLHCQLLSSPSFLVICLLSRCFLTIQVYEANKEKHKNNPVGQHSYELTVALWIVASFASVKFISTSECLSLHLLFEFSFHFVFKTLVSSLTHL